MASTLTRKRMPVWSPEDPVSISVLDSLFNDMGIGLSTTPADLEALGATREYCINAILQATHSGSHVRIGYIECLARAFYDGYVTCWAKKQAHI